MYKLSSSSRTTNELDLVGSQLICLIELLPALQPSSHRLIGVTVRCASHFELMINIIRQPGKQKTKSEPLTVVGVIEANLAAAVAGEKELVDLMVEAHAADHLGTVFDVGLEERRRVRVAASIYVNDLTLCY